MKILNTRDLLLIRVESMLKDPRIVQEDFYTCPVLHRKPTDSLIDFSQLICRDLINDAKHSFIEAVKKANPRADKAIDLTLLFYSNVFIHDLVMRINRYCIPGKETSIGEIRKQWLNHLKGCLDDKE